MRLLRWMSLPVPTEAEVGRWGRGCNGGPASCTPLNSDILLPGVPGFFHKLPQLWSSLLLSLQAVFFMANSCPLPGTKPTFQHPASLRNRRHTTQAGVCKPVAQIVQAVLTLSCLPQTIGCILLQSSKVLFLSQLISPP